ncbi:hypothetical protein Tco_0633738 [Tanacetum coccineum]
MAKGATMDLADDDEEEEQTRQCARWTCDEEILLTKCWIETSENGRIEADRTNDSFWGQIMDDFNSGTTQGYRTRIMLTGKWTRINGDCQKFNAIYKHLERKSREMRLIISRLQRLQAGTSVYEAKKQKEMAITEFKELEFLTIDPDKLPEPKAALFKRNKKK